MHSDGNKFIKLFLWHKIEQICVIHTYHSIWHIYLHSTFFTQYLYSIFSFKVKYLLVWNILNDSAFRECYQISSGLILILILTVTTLLLRPYLAPALYVSYSFQRMHTCFANLFSSDNSLNPEVCPMNWCCTICKARISFFEWGDQMHQIWWHLDSNIIQYLLIYSAIHHFSTSIRSANMDTAFGSIIQVFNIDR